VFSMQYNTATTTKIRSRQKSVQMLREINTRSAVHGAERGLTYLPTYLEKQSERCSPRRGRSQHSTIRNQTLRSPPHTATASETLIAVAEETNGGRGNPNHLGLEDVVEGRRHADGEAAAVVLRPRPRVRDASRHQGPLFGGRRLRWRRGRQRAAPEAMAMAVWMGKQRQSRGRGSDFAGRGGERGGCAERIWIGRGGETGDLER